MQLPWKWTRAGLGLRIATGYVVVIGTMLAGGLLVAWKLAEVVELDRRIEQADRAAAVVQRWSGMVQANLERAATATRLDAAVGDDAALRERLGLVERSLVQGMAAAAEASAGLQKQVESQGVSAPVQRLIETVRGERERFVKLRASLRDEIQMGEVPKTLDADLDAASRRMLAALQALNERLVAERAEANAQLLQRVRDAIVALAVAGGLALAIAAAVAWRTTRVITVPLHRTVALTPRIEKATRSTRDLTQRATRERDD